MLKKQLEQTRILQINIQTATIFMVAVFLVINSLFYFFIFYTKPDLQNINIKERFRFTVSRKD